jgi:ABC-type glycerol-3-phosphate transport system substrate-binding protein
MVKRLVSISLALVMMFTMLVACGGTQNAGETTSTQTAVATTAAEATTPAAEEKTPVEIEVVASQPEYLAQETEIWKTYTDANPHVTIKMTTVNEDTKTAFATRVAAGNPPDIQSFIGDGATKDTYKTYVNLLNIDYPYFDKYQYDVKNAWTEANGVADYLPVLATTAGPSFSFIYYEDEMAKTGLTPRDSIRSMADLDKFLADLKTYTTKNKIPYVLDTGWHSWCWFFVGISDWATAMGSSMDQEKELWLKGTIKWTDLEKNPYVPAFEKLKEYYDKGYLPAKWWTRDWEKDFEAGFIAKKSILCFHGPWLWTKVQSADPAAKLSGFPLPANKNGVIQNSGVEVSKGAVMFSANEGKANFEETKKAFIWFNSPETIKMRAEAFGEIPAVDLKDVGYADIQAPQYQTVIKPISEGFFGKVTFDSSLWAQTLVAKYQVKNTSQVMNDDAMAPKIGEYFEGKITIADLMKIYQDRYNTGIKVTP